MTATAIARLRPMSSLVRLQCGMVVACLSLAGSWGCQEPTGPRTVANADPAVKIPAIKQAVADKDQREVAAMVKSLESDDPAVRLYAIEGLQRLTGQDFGYLFYAGEEERAPAVEKWKQWLEDQADH
jgi:hypothetical protein